MQGENFVALLGTKGGPAIRPGSTNPSSSLLMLDGHGIVVDCGLGVTRGLVDQGFHLKNLRHIFITHLHSDHYLELGPLLHTAWTAGLKDPVTVFGPAGLKNYWQNFLLSMKADIDLRIDDEGRIGLADLISVNVLDEGTVFEKDGVTVSALRNQHPPLVDTFALSFKGKSHHVVFSGDTAYLPQLADFCRDADLLIHEAMLKPALDALFERVGNADERLMHHWLQSHTVAEDAGRLAQAANVGALALNHLIPSDDPDYTQQHWREAVSATWKGDLYIGSDGLRIELDRSAPD